MLHRLHEAVSEQKEAVDDEETLTHLQTDSQRQTFLLDHLVGVLVRDLEGTSHVPRNVDHGHDRLHFLHLVPLEALQSELILVGCKDNK